VPGQVESLAFNGGRLFAVCRGGRLVCVGLPGKPGDSPDRP